MSQSTQWLVKQIRNLPLEQFWFMSSRKKTLSETYSKEPKSAIAFNLLTFFRADLIQSEASWKLSSTFDWLLYAWKNAN